jgi:KipI family sensor histidine kinase inhibitor
MVTVRLRSFGDRAVLAEVGTLGEVLELRARLSASRPPGVLDVVPAARTVLVRVDPAVLTVAGARSWITEAAASAVSAGEEAAGPLVELPTVYDGEDLDDVAAVLGCSVDEVVARHSAAAWTVAFTGFAPGFGYLVSPDWTQAVPRRTTPRTRVPAGSVAVAGEFTGAYPRDTPGGWQILGTTPVRLFDPGSGRPALLAPGVRVRFVASRAEARGAAEPAREVSPVSEPTASAAVLRIAEPGLRATIQDQGRPGHAAEGIAVSGAADRAALRTANRLVGNAEHAAGIEVTMGGLRAVALQDAWFAVTGAWGPITLDGHAVDPYEAQAWPAGAELEVGWFAHGARAYLAVRGGIDAAPTAGSRSTDTLAGVGPAPLWAGDELALARDAVGPVPPEDLHPWGAPHDALIELALAPGPRADWFTPEALACLYETVWTVSGDADRVGIRLDGPALARTVSAELPSEGMVPGALQVPPAGRPVILGPDGPVTGGYPVIAVVADADRDALAQARPGTRVRFRHAR